MGASVSVMRASLSIVPQMNLCNGNFWQHDSASVRALLNGGGQEDVNGEKLTVEKYGGFLVPIFSRFTQSFSRFIYKGRKR